MVDIGVDRVTSGKSDEGVFGVSVSISAVPLSTIFGSRQFRRTSARSSLSPFYHEGLKDEEEV